MSEPTHSAAVDPVAPEPAPRSSVSVDGSENRVMVRVDARVHTRAGVLAAGYAFVDRCYVLLDVDGDDGFLISLTGREPMDPEALRALGGELGNELLAQALRKVIAEQHAPLIGQVVGRALAGASVRPAPPALEPAFDLSQLDALELDDEPFDDPLGIAVPWEEKYGKPPGEGEGG